MKTESNVHKLTFSKMEGRSSNFAILQWALIALCLVGVAGFFIMYIVGHNTLGSSSVVPWGMPIILAIYLIGLSAGSLILSSLTYVFGKEQYRPIARLAVFMALVLILGAMLGIVLDLGRPEKSWRLFAFFVMNNMRSMFAINGILYGGYFLISLIYLSFIFAENKKVTKIMGIVAVSWASLVHMGTGAIFGFIATRPIFYSPIKPLEFLSAAMVSGLALLILAIYFVFKFTGRKFDQEIIFQLSRLLLALIAFLTLLVFIDKLTHFYPPHRDAVIWLLTGPFAWIFWGLQIVCAYVIPMIILINPRTRKSLKWVLTAAFFVVVGIFGERFALVVPGTAQPLPLYPGHIEGTWGMAGTFCPSPVEMMVSVGIFALMGLIFIMGLKNLELLPVSDDADAHT
ncbi:MAG: NrfD/PsrC family molybdoenzyme membrane anchor subunit [Syntrophales bacterium]